MPLSSMLLRKKEWPGYIIFPISYSMLITIGLNQIEFYKRNNYHQLLSVTIDWVYFWKSLYEKRYKHVKILSLHFWHQTLFTLTFFYVRGQLMVTKSDNETNREIKTSYYNFEKYIFVVAISILSVALSF